MARSSMGNRCIVTTASTWTGVVDRAGWCSAKSVGARMPGQPRRRRTMALKVEKHETATYVAPRAIELIPPDALTDLGDGEYTATVGAHPDLRDDTGGPAQAGDVLSVQPDGV